MSRVIHLDEKLATKRLHLGSKSPIQAPMTEIIPSNHLIQPLSIGFGESLTTEVNIGVIGRDGKRRVIEQREGHSLTYGFLWLLYCQMAGIYRYDKVSVVDGGNIFPDNYAKSSYIEPGDDREGCIVATASQAATCRITVTADTAMGTENTLIKVWGATGMTELNGEFYAKYVSSNTFDLYTDETEAVPLDTSLASPLSNTPECVMGGHIPDYVAQTSWWASTDNFDNPYLVIGTGNTPVRFFDWTLDEYISHGTGTNQVEYTATTITAPVIDAPNDTGIIQFSAQMANNSGSSITAKEIGIGVDFEVFTSDIQQKMLVARDLISAGVGVAILHGEALDIQYRLKIDSDPASGNGGWVRQFLELMYRQFAYNTTREVKTWENANHTAATYTGFHMRVQAEGGFSKGTSVTANSIGAEKNYFIGPLFGVYSGAAAPTVSIDDFSLVDGGAADSIIHHGRDTDEVLIYGSLCENPKLLSVLTLTAGAGGDTITSLTVNQIATELLSATVNFNTDLATTAGDIATNIAAYSGTSGYTAEAIGAVIYISKVAPAHQVDIRDDFVNVPTFTGTLDGTSQAGASFEVSKLMENRSGATITAYEAGLFCCYNYIDPEYIYMMARHPISGGFAIPNNQIGKLTYRIIGIA